MLKCKEQTQFQKSIILNDTDHTNYRKINIRLNAHKKCVPLVYSVAKETIIKEKKFSAHKALQ